MDVRIDPSWKNVLQPEFDKPYFKELTDFVRAEYKTKRIFPPAGLIFNAFDQCPFDRVKVVILGQDPYHGEGQAHGLCFSVNDGVRFPPSLVNIFKEIEDELGKPAPATGNLLRWSRQGGAAAQRHAHRAGAHPRLAPRAWLGAVYRQRHPHAGHAEGAPRVPAVGSLRTKQSRFHRPHTPPRAAIGTPVALLGTPGLFRQRPFRPRQPIPARTRAGGNRLVREWKVES